MMNEMKKSPKIALGTWSWGVGAAGGDQVFGNHLGEADLKAVFDAAMKEGLNLWDMMWLCYPQPVTAPPCSFRACRGRGKYGS